MITTEGLSTNVRSDVKVILTLPALAGLGTTEFTVITGGFWQPSTTHSGYASPKVDHAFSASVAWHVAATAVPDGCVIVIGSVNCPPDPGAVIATLLA